MKYYPILGTVIGKVLDLAIFILAAIGLCYVVTMIASHFGLINVFFYAGAEAIPPECYQGLK